MKKAAGLPASMKMSSPPKFITRTFGLGMLPPDFIGHVMIDKANGFNTCIDIIRDNNVPCAICDPTFEAELSEVAGLDIRTDPNFVLPRLSYGDDCLLITQDPRTRMYRFRRLWVY